MSKYLINNTFHGLAEDKLFQAGTKAEFTAERAAELIAGLPVGYLVKEDADAPVEEPTPVVEDTPAEEAPSEVKKTTRKRTPAKSKEA
jgi:hypothetical protein